MADGTHIAWTEATWNPITGCSVVSHGCTNCYAMQLAGTRLQHHPSRAGLTRQSKAGPVWTGEVRFNEQWIDQPLRWSRPRRVFVCAHGDLFHEGVPDAWIDRVFAVMALASQHTFQVLTKRPERMRDYALGLGRNRAAARSEPQRIPYALDDLRDGGSPPCPLPNVWLGTSVEDQARANQRIPLLLDTPAAVRWISAEPLLGQIDISASLDGLDWVVIGGESGRSARPFVLGWGKDLISQCRAAGVAVFMKQTGSNAVNREGERCPTIAGKGTDMAEWPEEMQVQEYPG